jgi:hypothetical protein
MRLTSAECRVISKLKLLITLTNQPYEANLIATWGTFDLSISVALI